MEVQLSTEQKAELCRMANQTGRSAGDVAREAVDRYLTEESRFHAGVQASLEAAARGDFVPTAEVWAKIERALNSPKRLSA